MGREIRRVPPNWEHPQRTPENDRYGHGGLQPMIDQNYADAKREWIDGLMQWEAGTYPGQHTFSSCEWWDYAGGPPDATYYRPWKDDEATWFQVWETVSEGTPTSPPFATKEELADYLAANGDFWDQERCKSREDCRLFGMKFGEPGWGRERAYRYVMGDGWAPSMVVVDGKVMDGVEFVTRDPA